MAGYGGLNEALLLEYKAKGLNMETATSNRAGTDISQVWSSLDPDNLEVWPWEAREPKGPNGTPVVKGAETLVAFSSDVFNAWYTNMLGFFMCYSLYFMNFGEANDMAFCHIWMQNATHYFKLNDAVQDSYGAQFPNGIKWHEFTLVNNQRFVEMGGESTGWALHPATGLVVHYSSEPTVASFTPQEPPQLGWKMLRAPRFEEQEMKMSNCYVWGGGEFGMVSTRDMMTGYAANACHLLALGEYDPFPGVVHPYTGETPMRGWPGVPSEDSEWYNKWLWGGYSGNTYTCFSTITDFEAKDSLSWDWVIIVTPAGGKTVTTPETSVDNINSPVMQEAFSMQLDYQATAQTVFAGGLRGPVTPVPPALTVIPGDREVTITWSDINPKTPDSFYYYLEENNLNPGGYYRENDFEGYRLYRSFVGPNDSHSELLETFSVSAGNIQFHYVDTDKDYYESTGTVRIQNGMKIWYSLVPFDKNYDSVTGEEFSLPDPDGGKTWYGAGKAEFNVVTRSEASDFRAASLGELGIVYDGLATTAASSVEIAGDGTGNLLDAPQWLQPKISNVALVPVNNERITQDKTVYIECSDAWHNSGGCSASRPYGTREIKMVDGSYEMVSAKKLISYSDDAQSLSFYDAPTSEGNTYAIEVEFSGLNRPNQYRNAFVHNIDPGTYTGTVETVTRAGCGPTSRMGSAPSISALVRNGRFTVTWKASGSDMTAEVKNVTRGTTLPAVTYVDEEGGWGLMTPEANGGEIAAPKSRVNGLYYDEAFRYKLPISDRTAQLLDKIPSDYANPFGLWVNYMVWKISGGVPADGTVWTIDYAWGTWNADKTVFTQVADLPSPGVDKWKIEIKASTMDPEDADLSKVSVVPNPYIGTSFLDLSPSSRRIEFINLPARCTIRIYSLGGNLVNVLNHIGANRQGWGDYTTYDRAEGAPKTYTGYDNHGGTEPWNLRNRFGQTVASGLYFYHVTDSRGEQFTGKFYLVI